MNLSEIQFVPVKLLNGLVGFVSFVLDNKYYVGSIAVYTRPNGIGYRLVYPTKKIGDKNIQTFYPIDPKVGKVIEDKVSGKVYGIFERQSNENYDGTGNKI